MTERLEMRIREIYLRDEDLMIISNEDKGMDARNTRSFISLVWLNLILIE